MIHEDVEKLAEGMRTALNGLSLSDLGLEQMRAMVEMVATGNEIPLHSVENQLVNAGGHRIPIRVYRPNEERHLPAVLWFHGGGFALGSLETGDEICRRIAQNANCVVINVDYRLAPEFKFPAGFNDCVDVYRWATAASPEVNGFDGANVSLAGDSAGGNFAMALSIFARENGLRMPTCQVSIYGTGDLNVSNPELGDLPFLSVKDVEWFWDTYLSDPIALSSPYASPNNIKSVAGLPPLFMVTAEHDPTRDGCEAFAERLLAEVPGSEIKRYEGMYHGFFGRPEMFNESAKAHQDVAQFLLKHTKNKPSQEEEK